MILIAFQYIRDDLADVQKRMHENSIWIKMWMIICVYIVLCSEVYAARIYDIAEMEFSISY